MCNIHRHCEVVPVHLNVNANMKCWNSTKLVLLLIFAAFFSTHHQIHNSEVEGMWPPALLGLSQLYRPFITELSVSIKLSPAIMTTALLIRTRAVAKQGLLSCSHLLLPIDRCSLHYQHRGYLHDTGTLRMLMMLLSATRMLVSWGREGEGGRERRREGEKEGAKHGRKEEIKRDCTQRLSREWWYNEVLDRFNTNNRRGHCRSQVLLISLPFLKQIKLSATACVSIRSGWGPLRTAWFRCCLKWISR